MAKKKYVLEFLEALEEPKTWSEILKETGMSEPTLLGYLNGGKEKGIIQYDSQRRKYSLNARGKAELTLTRLNEGSRKRKLKLTAYEASPFEKIWENLWDSRASSPLITPILGMWELSEEERKAVAKKEQELPFPKEMKSTLIIWLDKKNVKYIEKLEPILKNLSDKIPRSIAESIATSRVGSNPFEDMLAEPESRELVIKWLKAFYDIEGAVLVHLNTRRGHWPPDLYLDMARKYDERKAEVKPLIQDKIRDPILRKDFLALIIVDLLRDEEFIRCFQELLCFIDRYERLIERCQPFQPDLEVYEPLPKWFMRLVERNVEEVGDYSEEVLFRTLTHILIPYIEKNSFGTLKASVDEVLDVLKELKASGILSSKPCWRVKIVEENLPEKFLLFGRQRRLVNYEEEISSEPSQSSPSLFGSK